MTMLWLVILVVTAATVAALVVPLVRRPAAVRPRLDFELAIYRDQLTEIDRDLERGLLTPAEAEGARVEIQRRLLAAAERTKGLGDAGAGAASIRRRYLSVAVGTVVPLLAVGLYLAFGSPDMADLPLAQRQAEIHGAADQGELERMVAKLAERLEREPGNGEGWMLLGRSYRALGLPAEAAEAFGRAVEASDREPALLSLYAEALMMAHDGVIGPTEQALFEEALAKVPDQTAARYYLALAKAQVGDMQGALAAWAALAGDAAPEAPWLPTVRARIEETARALGQEPPAVASRQSTPPDAAAAPRVPSREDMEAVARLSPEERTAMIRSMVDGLAARLAENPDDLDGWQRLAQAYEVLGEADKARDARARAEALRSRAGGR